jgi:hypothetical protein
MRLAPLAPLTPVLGKRVAPLPPTLVTLATLLARALQHRRWPGGHPPAASGPASCVSVLAEAAW